MKIASATAALKGMECFSSVGCDIASCEIITRANKQLFIQICYAPKLDRKFSSLRCDVVQRILLIFVGTNEKNPGTNFICLNFTSKQNNKQNM